MFLLLMQFLICLCILIDFGGFEQQPSYPHQTSIASEEIVIQTDNDEKCYNVVQSIHSFFSGDC